MTRIFVDAVARDGTAGAARQANRAVPTARRRHAGQPPPGNPGATGFACDRSAPSTVTYHESGRHGLGQVRSKAFPIQACND